MDADLRATVEAAIDVLNNALDIDPVAINLMFLQRTIVSPALADQTPIQVGLDEDLRYYTRPLGVINGMFGTDADGYGYIMMLVNPIPKGGPLTVEEFALRAYPCMITGFILRDPDTPDEWEHQLPRGTEITEDDAETA